MVQFEKIYPVSAMQRKQGELKQAAQEGIVRITENGSAAYVFCSEDVFGRILDQAAEDAAAEARMHLIVNRGRSDIAAGRTYKDTEAAMRAVEQKVLASHA